MHKSILFLLFIFMSATYADFALEKVEVTISDIQTDGSVSVHESIKFIIYGDYATSIYDSGLTTDQLSFWSSNIGLSDLKLHINPSVVDIQDLRVRPQPRTQCNSIQKTCHGEIILDYMAYPSEANTTTGVFLIESYKPRTIRYTINPNALSFTTISDGNLILYEDIHLNIELPDGSTVLDANPQPTSTAESTLSWTNIVLVKFSLIFDVEESIDQEVSEFFASRINNIASTLQSPQGIALVILAVIFIASYAYIIMSKRRDDS